MPLLAAGLAAADMTVVLIALAVLLGAARLCGEVARGLGLPAVLGEIVAGILLGPTVLGYLPLPVHDWLFPATGPARVGLEVFVTLGVTLLLLVAGLEVDLSTVWRQGRAAAWVSLTGMVAPFAVGFGLAWLLPGLLGMGEHAARTPFALFVGIALSITALPVIAKILMDLDLFRSDIGMLVMSAAMVNDLAGWMGFALVLAMMGGGEGPPVGPIPRLGHGVLATLLLILAFAAAMMTLGRWLVHRLLPVLQTRWAWPGGVITFVLVVTLACAAFTEAIGVHAVFGAFIAGVAIGDSSHLRERTRDNIHQFITYIFAPVFFASIGLRLNFIRSFDLPLVLIVLGVALATKIGGCYLGAAWAGLGRRESLAIGFGMAARGAMEIILGQLAFEHGLISQEMLVAVIIMAVATSLVSGPAMQWLLGQARPSAPRLLPETQFIPALAATTLGGVLREMAIRAGQAGGIDADRIAQAVWKREQLMPTGVGNGLAVPHARMEEVQKPLLIIGRSAGGIDFNSPDGTPARLICLLLTPTHDQGAQTDIIRSISHAVSDPTRRERVVGAASLTELMAALQLGDTHPAPAAA